MPASLVAAAPSFMLLIRCNALSVSQAELGEAAGCCTAGCGPTCTKRLRLGYSSGQFEAPQYVTIAIVRNRYRVCVHVCMLVHASAVLQAHPCVHARPAARGFSSDTAGGFSQWKVMTPVSLEAKLDLTAHFHHAPTNTGP